ncbi:MAG TPA: deoxyhypusine synthase, partial [Nitrososphaera sp.]|nr:deoxyhypusine synthase [Nitrososphaera sp.]
MAARKTSKGKELLRHPVKDYSIGHNDDLGSIFSKMANSGGFESRNLADGVEILRRMINDKNCTKFM